MKCSAPTGKGTFGFSFFFCVWGGMLGKSRKEKGMARTIPGFNQPERPRRLRCCLCGLVGQKYLLQVRAAVLLFFSFRCNESGSRHIFLFQQRDFPFIDGNGFQQPLYGIFKKSAHNHVSFKVSVIVLFKIKYTANWLTKTKPLDLSKSFAIGNRSRLFFKQGSARISRYDSLSI